MKKILHCIIFFIVLILSYSCKGQEENPIELVEDVGHTNFDSIRAIDKKRNLELNWKPINKDSLLWRNKYGDIGIRSQRYLGELTECYLTNFNDAEKTPYKDIIDVSTFKLIAGDLGWGGYFKDKNNIYHFWGNSCGGGFYVEDADYKTFKVMNSCFLKDKYHIYDLRFGMLDDVDVHTFKIIDKEECIGQDKSGYIQHDRRLTETEVNDILNDR